MMDKTEALLALIEAVEAGEQISGNDDFWAAFHAAFPRQQARISEAVKAYHGSLDAAKSLHEALLPGWDYIIGHTNGGLTIHVKLEGQNDVFSDTPARAWLLAILRAYLSQQEAA